MNHNLRDLQTIIGYRFRDESLLESDTLTTSNLKLSTTLNSTH